MKVLIIDNFDSFTYNLYQYIGEILSEAQHQAAIETFSIIVKRNNELSLSDINTLAPDRIIISPGPGSPEDPAYFGVCAEVIAQQGKTTPLLGVCLGMQGIAHVFGGHVVKAPLPMHGKTSVITHSESGVFLNTPNHIEIMRYHSLMAKAQSLPECLKVTAVVGEHEKDYLRHYNEGRLQPNGVDDGIEIMAIEHTDYPIYGIQYHPESFATEGGKELIRNFLFNARPRTKHSG
ncbi:MAG TPA: aminodeoxychorismate/anthranilate synthase component II [Marinagarivorans sp.]